MHSFTWIFLFALILSTAVQMWLSLRNMRHVLKHRPAVPEEFADKVSLEEHQKAADYTVTKGAFGRVELFLGLFILLFWLYGGGLNWLDQFWRSFGWKDIYTGVAVLLSFAFISSLIGLPTVIKKVGFQRIMGSQANNISPI